MCVVLWPRLARWRELFAADPLADLLYDVPQHGSSHFQNNEISIGPKRARKTNTLRCGNISHVQRQSWQRQLNLLFTGVRAGSCGCVRGLSFSVGSAAIRPQWYSARCGFTYGRHDHLVACWYSSSIPTQRQPERRATHSPILLGARITFYPSAQAAASGQTPLTNANIILF